MVINQNFGIALHILIYLSMEDDYISSNELSKSINTNPVIVRKILKKLSCNNIIETKKGPYGSKLKKDIEDITLLDIYDSLYHEDFIEVTHSPNEKCPVGKIINDVLEEPQKEIREVLSKYTLKKIKGESL